ncbi:lysine-N-methylase [Clostridium sp. DSM 8431]|uniref:flagellin lysine-N-methylase n=1 Tax=Clostridium sp. DSM 8431 TaxID=1761781 RepID=UPI0008F35291|nr:flagellin lysine-N-methylase [Clostridium sp. DSM 8431]SFU70912.1 lysine-N-methylase [Clostridium sp. DSM 8431]
MNKKVKVISPSYIKEFKCIGGECEDTCCAGWDIDIDKVSFKKYFKTENTEMKKMFQKNIYNNEYCTSPDVDYGRVKLKKGKRCPFLDDKNLCVIYSNLGEDYLSNVCTCYPRILNLVDGKYERSLDVACPEAARIILSKEEGIKFEDREEPLGKNIVSGMIDTKSKDFKGTLIKYFNELRNTSIKIMLNRDYDLSKRLFVLGCFLENAEEKFYEEGNLNKLFAEYDVYNVLDEYEKNKFNYLLQVSFFKALLTDLNVFKEIDSESFKKYSRELFEGFDLDNIKDITEDSEKFIKAFSEYEESYLNKYSYVFENYLVNFMYNNLFPFTESESAFDGYIMLLVRFSFIRFYLVGRALRNGTESMENIINMIQSFSKAVEHHKTFLSDVLEDIKDKEFDNMEFAKTLL